MEIEKYSKQWWNNEFKKGCNWEDGIDGNIQTKLFSDMVFGLINPTIKKDIANLDNSFVDFGCAYGQGLEMLFRLNQTIEAVGVDFSDLAVTQAKINYPNNDFYTDISQIKKEIDLIYASQIVGVNQKNLINYLTENSNNYVIILRPFDYKDSENDKMVEKLDNIVWDKPEWITLQNTIVTKTDDFYNGTKQQLLILKKIF